MTKQGHAGGVARIETVQQCPRISLHKQPADLGSPSPGASVSPLIERRNCKSFAGLSSQIPNHTPPNTSSQKKQNLKEGREAMGREHWALRAKHQPISTTVCGSSGTGTTNERPRQLRAQGEPGHRSDASGPAEPPGPPGRRDTTSPDSPLGFPAWEKLWGSLGAGEGGEQRGRPGVLAWHQPEARRPDNRGCLENKLSASPARH